MALCPKCGKEIADSAVVCKHCHATIGTPQRPIGVTVIAALTLLGAAQILISAIGMLFRRHFGCSVILGIRIPDVVNGLVMLILGGLALYCGLGFLKQKAQARRIFLWLAGFVILSSLITVGGSLTGLLTIAVLGYIVYYLVRRKDYFTN
ncbi:MAG: zinc ribbon domain-containing protein [bacterium]|nr:zinc ribbon domain-containing protein [bacterium]